MIRSHRHMLPKGRLSRTLPWLLPEHFLRHLDFLVSPSCACSHLLLGKVQGDNDANSYRPSRSNAPAAIRNPSSRSSRSSQCPRHASAYVSTRPLSSLLPVYVYKKILTNYYSTRWSRPPLPSAIPRSSRPRKPPPSTSAACLHCPVLHKVSPHHPRVASLPTSPYPPEHQASHQSRLRERSRLVVDQDRDREPQSTCRKWEGHLRSRVHRLVRLYLGLRGHLLALGMGGRSFPLV